MEMGLSSTVLRGKSSDQKTRAFVSDAQSHPTNGTCSSPHFLFCYLRCAFSMVCWWPLYEPQVLGRFFLFTTLILEDLALMSYVAEELSELKFSSYGFSVQWGRLKQLIGCQLKDQ